MIHFRFEDEPGHRFIISVTDEAGNVVSVKALAKQVETSLWISASLSGQLICTPF